MPCILLVAIGLAGGCGSRNAGGITIQGTVTFDGKPLPDGQVVFIPVDPKLGAAGGDIVSGTFVVTTYRGPHKVEVYSLRSKVRPGSGGEVQPLMELVNIIPARYGEETILTCDVQSPNDRPAFTLTTQP
jgi:hypothetical protein